MFVEFAISAGGGLPLRSLPTHFGMRAMTVPPADSTAASPGFAHLLQAIVERRDQTSFAALFDHYAPRVKAYLRRLGAADGLAEDITQEVMLTVWNKAHNYDPAKAGVSTWIFTIARNLRIDALRRERRPMLDADDPRFAADPAPGADEEVDIARQEQKVRAAIRTLPDEQAKVVTMAFYEGRSHGEIAAQLALPLGTVKSRLRLAFRRVRGQVGERE
jgi:RNA polymerase sigma-70 factor (ECF subfamily)